jgi:hypothetical protein
VVVERGVANAIGGGGRRQREGGIARIGFADVSFEFLFAGEGAVERAPEFDGSGF